RTNGERWGPFVRGHADTGAYRRWRGRLSATPCSRQVAARPVGQARRANRMPPRGTRDILPAEARVRERVIDAARERFAAYGYSRIVTPTFEETEVFLRGVGMTSDVVRKEMYTFTDGGRRSLTLRPEGTAPVVRAYLADSHALPIPFKGYYVETLFRYGRPQKGRLREFRSFGVEVVGEADAEADVEVI